jgi:hypothetical protein
MNTSDNGEEKFEPVPSSVYNTVQTNPQDTGEKISSIPRGDPPPSADINTSQSAVEPDALILPADSTPGAPLQQEILQHQV